MLHVKKKSKMLADAWLDTLFDALFVLYLFTHIALGWNAGYAWLRHLVTLGYLYVSLLLTASDIRKRGGRICVNAYIRWGSCVLIYFAASAAWSFSVSETVKIFIAAALSCIVVYPLTIRIRKPCDIRRVMNLLITGSCITGAYVLLKYQNTNGIVRLGFDENHGNIINILSHMCAFASVFSLRNMTDAFRHKRKTAFVLWCLLDAFLIYIVLRTGSKMGMILLLFGYYFFFFFMMHGKYRLIYTLAAIAAGYAGFRFLLRIDMVHQLYARAFQILFNFIFRRGGYVDISTSDRSGMILAGIRLWSRRPVLGWGAGTFASVSGFGMYAHNNYIELLSNLGISGLGVFYSYVLSSAVRLFQCPKKGNSLCSLGAVLCIMIFTVDMSSVYYTGFLTWTYFVLANKTAVFAFKIPKHNRKDRRVSE